MRLVFLIILFVFIACQSTRDPLYADVTKAELGPSFSPNNLLQTWDSDKGSVFRQLQPGQSLLIHYINSSCFHYQNETVKVTKTAHGYLLSHTMQESGHEIRLLSDMEFSPSFGHTLQIFLDNCGKALEEHAAEKKEMLFLSTSSRSLTLHDGLHLFDIPIKGQADFFTKLIASISTKAPAGYWNY